MEAKNQGQMQAKRSKVIAVMGPTAVGKSGLALQVAKDFIGAIVNADSMQIYRYMDIGTAKPTAAERTEVAHHLLDIVDPDQDFDASLYSQMAREAINSLVEEGKVAIVAGGTGLYLKALFHGLFPADYSNESIRERLRRQGEKDGGVELYNRLKQIDPGSAGRVHPNDLFRIIRALEVWELTGKPLSVLQKEHGFKENPFFTLKIGLKLPRSELYKRINRRVEEMMELGLLAEVRGLLDRGYGPNLKSMQALGYRHMVQHLINGMKIAEAVRTMKRDTRRYAKRQLTWFRGDQEIRWFHPEETEEIAGLVKEFIAPGGERKG
ncbi:MAG: tRNA (adenosine(37)-N6)-dimethylallyltransferase MiaA [Deltaproteobacteria bacterium]|jgi:tRNA dimethylallyltransferase